MTFQFVPTRFTKKCNTLTGGVEEVKTLISKTKTGYEVLDGACVPYYDFEREYKTEQERKDNFKSDLEFAMNALQSQYPKAKIYTLDASGYSSTKSIYKNSFHFIVRGKGYYNSPVHVPRIEGFDPKVYNSRQLFRLPYCSKENEDRPLIRYSYAFGVHFKTIQKCKSNYNESLELYLVQNITGEELIEVETAPVATPAVAPAVQVEVQPYLDAIEAKFPVMKNKQHTRTTEVNECLFMYYRDIVKDNCPLCHRIHNDNRMYGYLAPNKKLFLKCNRSDKSLFVKNFGDTTDAKAPETKVPDVSVPAIFYKHKPIVFNEQYCANYKPLMDDMNNGVDTALIAGTGVGKTVASSKSASARPGMVAGVLSFRISLAQKYKEDFKGFACYNDIEKRSIDAKRWICQLDSLHRIKNKALDTLYIDEVSQVRRHLNATTFMKNRNYLQNLQVLKTLIRKAKQIIIMDANMDPVDIEWIENIRGKKLKVFINEATPRKQTIAIVENEQQLVRMAKCEMAKGRKIAIAHNGGVKHHEPLRRILGKDKNILVINSKTIDDEKVQNALNNPNEEFGKYDAVIYSPSVQSGVSYDIKKVFHRVYGIFSNCTNSSGDACQMLNRVRHPMDKTTIVCVKQYPSAETRTVKQLMDIIRSLRQHLELKRGEDTPVTVPFNDYNEIDFINNEVCDDIVRANIEKNMDRLNFKKNFIYHQRRYGNDVIFMKQQKKTPELDGELKKLKAAFTEQVKDEDAQKLLDAVNLSFEQVDALKKKLDDNQKVLQDELVALKKYSLNQFYKMDQTADTKEWYKTYDDRRVKKVYHNSSKYFRGQSFDESLERMKESEIKRDRYNRTGVNEYVSTEQCVVNYFLNKPCYQKEKVMIGWLKTFGFDNLYSNVELDTDMMKTRLKAVIDRMNEHTFNVLEKAPKKMKVLKMLKINDKNFMKAGLQFINGSIREYYGVSVAKKSKHSKVYVLNNKYIKGGVLKNPFVAHDVLFDDKTPVLGKVVGDDEETEEEEEEPQYEKTCEEILDDLHERAKETE